MDLVKSNKSFDHIIINDDIRDALDDVKDTISKYRPDLLPPKKEASSEGYEVTAT